MRMWNVNPLWMCDKHLVQEHADMHVAAEMLAKGHSLKGHVARHLVEVHHIQHRHNRLEAELEARHIGHRTLLVSYRTPQPDGVINVQANRQKLLRSCHECARRQQALRVAHGAEYFRAAVEQLQREGLLSSRAATQAVKRVDTVVARSAISSGRHKRPELYLPSVETQASLAAM